MTKFYGPSLFCAALISVSAAKADDTPQLHPLEAACVEYELSGQMQSGTTIRCHRNYAYEQYEIQNVSMGIAGFTQNTNQHTITIGEIIYSIDLDTNTGTQTTNPMYQQLAGSLDDADPEDLTEAFFAAMGFTPTGVSKTIANTACDVYNSQMMGTVCMTDNGLMLEQSVMGNNTVATSVSIGDGGEDANYTLYQNVPITEGPDLSNIMQMMNQQ